MSPRIVDKQEKRFLIAHAAAGVFGQKGFDKTRMDDVAREAGVGKGTIYEYFENKEALFQGSMEILFSMMAGSMKESVEQDLPPLELLRAFSDATINAMEELGHGYRFFLEYMLQTSRKQDDFPLMRNMLEQFREGTATLLRQAAARGEISRNKDLDQAAAAFAAWFDGAVFHWIVIPEPGLKEMADSFLDLFLAGLAKE